MCTSLELCHGAAPGYARASLLVGLFQANNDHGTVHGCPGIRVEK